MNEGPAPTRFRAAVLLPLGLAAVGLLLATAALLGAGLGGGGGDGEAVTREALLRGNRLVRRGELEAAVDAYRAAWPAAGPGAATLAYNLGTTYHRLGRLPEALLWYRRSQHRAPADRWVVENLELARTELAATRLGPASFTAHLAARPAWTATAAVLLAWLAFALLLARPRLARRLPAPLADHGWAAAAGLALLVWSAGATLAAWGPRPAVLVDACVGEAGRLEPGSEVWVTPAGDDWAVSGGPAGLLCPGPAVGLVDGAG